MIGIGLAGLSAFAWAALDAQRKGLAAELGPLVLVAAMTAGQALVFGLWWAGAGAPGPAAGYLLPALGVLVANLVASVAFVAAVRASALSTTIPLLSFTPALATIAGAAWLGEWPRPAQVVGIVAVVVGALLLHAGGAGGGPIAWARALLEDRGARLMLGVALLWSVSGVLDKLALAHADVPVHGAIQSGGIAALIVGGLVVAGRAGELRRLGARPGRVLLLVATSVVAVGVQYGAVLAWQVSLVEATKRAVGLGSSVVVGRLAFGEPVRAATVVGVAVMGAGVSAIVLG